jgi:hypothetical protein
MANEYLKRTHTSSGNYKVFTFSLWIKGQEIGSTQQKPIYFYDGATLFQVLFERSSGTHPGSLLVYSSSTDLRFGGLYRDVSSWMNLVVNVDTTKSESNRISVYLNGSKLDLVGSQTSNTPNYPAENAELLSSVQTINALTGQGSYEVFDYFYVDGQALTPDVFGYYKKGDGYISAGSTQATDFKRGQWVPKAPKVIKSVINARGGFGVNGFYLPMNDASNFGADFHCEPNSIIKLKGEDFNEYPQPRNGAPTTTDAYVSQLRDDPYAANLVLAVPGIATSTSANLITNGTFENGTSGWTVINSSATLSVDSQGRLQVDRSGTNLNAYLNITTEIGKRYTLSANLWSGTGGNAQLRAYQSDLTTSYGVTTGSTGDKKSLSFTALETTTSIIVSVDNNSGNAFFDNIVVRQEDAPRDYSADIKGSGTNKTPTLSGLSGVGYELGGYYGSAYTSRSNNDYLEFPGTSGDFNVGTGDFTIEVWLNPDSTQSTNARIFGQDANSVGNWDVYINTTLASNQIRMMGGNVILTGGSGSSYGNLVGEQWNHFCLERYNGQLTTYMNGVAVYTQTYTSSIGDSNPFRIAQIGSNTYGGVGYGFNGDIQDFRVYKGVAKYKGGFDVPKPYTPVGIGAPGEQCLIRLQNNFATINPLGSGAGTFTDGSLTYNSSSDTGNANIGISTGNFYYEGRVTNASPNNGYIGIMEATEQNPLRGGGWVSHGAIAYKQNGEEYFKERGSAGSTISSYGDSYTTGDIIGIACDVTNNTVTFYKNGVSQGTTSQGPSSIQSNGTFTPFFYGSTVEWNINFGQNPTFSGNTTAGTFTDSNGKGLFKYEPPSGFLALCEDNLPTPAIKNPGEHFKTMLWTGDGAAGRSITGVGFQPDLVWMKKRTPVMLIIGYLIL